MMFSIYAHTEVWQTSKPLDQVSFVGYSVPHFNAVREELLKRLPNYPTLPLCKAELDNFLTVHEADYLHKIKQLAAGKTPDEQPKLSAECTGFEFFLDGYCYSLGGFYEAIDQMQASQLERAYIFALGGHHAFPARGHGYCMLNPMAAAVRYAQQHGFNKILILDYDIHHGDGTQTIFEHDPNVYHVSIHNLLDLYMAFQRVARLGTTSHAESIGQCNIPLLPAYFSADMMDEMSMASRVYRAENSLTAFQEAVDTTPFMPDLIFIFSGYDSHSQDCGNQVTDWTNDDFVSLTQMILRKAKQAGCPIISAHGGGYVLDITVAAALAHVETLAS